MRNISMAAAFSLVAMSPAMGDQRMQMELVQANPPGKISCEVIVFSADHIILSKDIERDGSSVLRKSGTINLDQDGLQRFEAAVTAMSDGTFQLGEAEDEVLEPPYVHLIYREGEAGETSLERRAVLPGTDIPPMMLALFEPVEAACVRR
jgi:galactose-1-phosphate uridylyltransferase